MAVLAKAWHASAWVCSALLRVAGAGAMHIHMGPWCRPMYGLGHADLPGDLGLALLPAAPKKLEILAWPAPGFLSVGLKNDEIFFWPSFGMADCLLGADIT